MNKISLSDLTPITFLQTFIIELMHASEQLGTEQSQQLIENIALTAGRFFEEVYRSSGKDNKKKPLNKESYIELILGLKNNIGGNFSLSSCTQERITMCNSSCPFGEEVVNSPELCRMTSSVFGGIAARNFGYAKVEIAKSIAQQDGSCEVYIHLDPESAKDRPGIEYREFMDENKHDPRFEVLQSRIEESMLKIWRKQSNKHVKKYQPPVIIANSEGMKKVLQSIEMIAPTSATILIQGQTGVGKELVARAIHAMSERCEKTFVPINCGAIAESLLESALFGHEKGAFTGAIEVHQGYFERAEGGTLFLDEVDSLSPAAQTRLLRVLQEGELERVGGTHAIQVNVRIISASNINLLEQVELGSFRNDLYYRINVVKLEIPALIERHEDLPALVNLILQRMSKKHNKTINSVSHNVMQQISAFQWPGNVRELENTLERSLLFTTGKEITELKLDSDIPPSITVDWKQRKEQAIEEVEKAYLNASLKQYHGNIKEIAIHMEISTRAVYNKLNKYKINPDKYRT
ncbi:two-component system, NtrC family, response regulator HydG [Bathymodiolus platifrons methanotrophic gill symbiont]|uniref:sigma 54-interacting transcriptional regulator n=1 Tax=Bathymodiolus platifrons methanotrophic gill symbiont TaxID=113268 RepID=UPI000B408901|nr:sigma 54-interacting transcriptional regulator [Bathymodiolus platifrons methanotrophic gill symbiont]GAW85995.1 two-component system, NtrC family, response regulator HydG [Bathymodiolus platifrons methanotrophic gill symbiont]